MPTCDLNHQFFLNCDIELVPIIITTPGCHNTNKFLCFLLLQMVMAVFAYIYHQSFVMPQSLSVEMILEQVWCFHEFLPLLTPWYAIPNVLNIMQILRNLTFEEQQFLYEQLGNIFQARQLLQA